jgi:hypothetical protein
MKMDRNLNADGRGKYALLLMRNYPNGTRKAAVDAAMQTLADVGMLDYGEAGSPSEFFVIRLRDKFAECALRAYAAMAMLSDGEWASEVDELADRSGIHSPHCKTPD